MSKYRLVRRFSLAAKIECRHVLMARAGLGMTIKDLCTLSRLNKATVVNFEDGRGKHQNRTLRKIRTTLESIGVEFLENEDGQIAVSLPPMPKDD